MKRNPLVVAVCFPGEDFSSYEHQRGSERPLERTLRGNVIRAEITLVGEYMSDPQLSVSWYFKLARGATDNRDHTQEAFEA